jgi:large subunit ribosomal protein L10
LAISKQRKSEILDTYSGWLQNSQAVFVIRYTRMNMKAVDALRAKVRDAGGSLHVVKNTMMQMALSKAGIHSKELESSLLFGFAPQDPPVLAKTLTEATKGSEQFELLGGFLGTEAISVAQMKALANLPPLPVMRAILLGTLQAPASKLVRTILEPTRQIASVVRAYSEKAPTAA